MSSPPFKAARISNLTETFKLQMAQYMSRASHFNLCCLSDMNKSFHTRALYQEAPIVLSFSQGLRISDLLDALMHDEQEDVQIIVAG